MRAGGGRSFTDFVSAEQSGLLRLSVLLAGDRDDAEELLQRALVATYGRWPRVGRSPAPTDDARRALLTSSTSRRWLRPAASDQVIESLPGRFDWSAAGQDDELAGVLRALPQRTRTALVRRHLDDLTRRETATASPGPAGIRGSHGSAPLQALRPGRDGTRGLALLEAPDLVERLESLAERTAPDGRDPGELVAEVVARHRARRLWRAALATVVVAVVAIAVLTGVPTAGSGSSAAPAGTVLSDATAVYTAPTRGSLAADTAFLDAVRGQRWALDALTPVPQPPLERRHVVWAGDLPGGRGALVVDAGPLGWNRTGSDRRLVSVAWFLGPTGATGEQMSMRSVAYRVASDRPSALADSSTGDVIVVGAPDDEIEVSFQPWVEADGAVRRTFEPVVADQGVVILSDDDMARGKPSLRYRVARDGIWVVGTPAGYADPSASPPPIALHHLRGAPEAAPGDLAAARRVEDVLARTGLSADQLTVTVVWAGDLVVPDGSPARASLLVAELPSGAHFVASALGYGPVARTSRSASCGSEIRPAGTPVDRQAFVLRCYAGGGARDTADPQLVLVGPREATRAVTRGWSGQELGRHPLTDGVAVAAAPSDMTNVEFLDDQGAVVARAAPIGTADLGD